MHSLFYSVLHCSMLADEIKMNPKLNTGGKEWVGWWDSKAGKAEVKNENARTPAMINSFSSVSELGKRYLHLLYHSVL